MMAGGALATVINWNGREDSLACLDSLARAQGVEAMLVVDNASQDGSVEAIRQSFPRTIIIANQQNLGFSRAVNQAIRYFLESASHDYFLILNNDALVDSQAVSRLRAALEGGEKAGIAVPKIYYPGPEKRLWYAGGAMDWKQGAGVHWRMGESDSAGLESQSQPREVSFAPGCALLIPRRVLESIGLFDERYFFFGEDVDYSLRLQKAGYRILYVPGAVVWHKVGGSAGRRGSAFIWYHMTRNRLLTVSKHARGWAFLQFALYFPLLWLAKAVSFALRGEPGVAAGMLKGARDFLQGRFEHREL